MLDVREYIRQLIDSDFDGKQASFAEICGVSPVYISHVLNGKTEPGPKVLDAIGVKKTKIVTIKYEFCESAQ